nr:immunoglobulin heavy chain junction region [Mus musculus]
CARGGLPRFAYW